MLGRDTVAAFRHAHETFSADRLVGDYTVDITQRASVDALLAAAKPDVAVNCAAYTNVDGAEREPDEAYRVNAWGVWNLGAACAAADVDLLHVSTDFVFNGEASVPYTEFDRPNPINVYGASKWAGEQALQWSGARYWIVRTQWLYGIHGKNFAYTMMRLAKERTEIPVVEDQRGAPAYAVDVAEIIRTVVEGCPPGVYHANNAGECSWYEFARAIVERAGHNPDMIRPIPASQYPTPTRRPAYSTLRRYSLELQGLDTVRPWPAALDDFMEKALAGAA